MLSAALISIPERLSVERLSRANWEREENGRTLRSVIQLQERPIDVDSETTAEMGLAIHQHIGIEPTLAEENGRYVIRDQETVKTIWAHIHILQGLVVVDRLGNRGFVRDIINNGLNLITDRAQNVSLDTARIARDHVDHWVRGFSDRQGRVDRGTVYGEGVEQDSVFGPELDRWTRRSVGWTTRFFGSPEKVRVSPKGSIILWANPPFWLFLSFLRTEILPYAIR